MAFEQHGVEVVIDPTGAVAGGRRASAAFSGVGQSALSMERTLTGIGSKLAAVFTFTAAAGFVRSMARAAESVGDVRTALSTVLRDNNSVERAFARIADESKRLGGNLEESGMAFARFASRSSGAVERLDDLLEIYVAVNEAQVALYGSAQGAGAALEGISRILAKGQLEARGLMMLEEAVPGTTRLLEQMFDITEGGMRKFLQDNKVLASDVLPRLAAEWRKAFGAEAAAGVSGLDDRVAALRVSWMQFLAVLNEGTAGDALAKTVDAVARVVDYMTTNLPSGLAKARAVFAQLFAWVLRSAASVERSVASVLGSLDWAAKIAKAAGYLTGTAGVMGDVSGKLRDQAAASRTAAGEFDDMAASFESVAREQNALSIELERGAASATAAGKAAKGAGAGFDDLGEGAEEARAKVVAAFDALEASFSPVAAAMKSYREAVELGSAALKAGVDPARVRWVTERAWIEAVNGLLDSYFGKVEEIAGATGDRTRDLIEWAKQIEAYLDTAQGGGLTISAGSDQELADLEASWDETIRQIGENSTRELQGAFTEFFSDLLSGGVASFEELGKRLLQIFAKMIAEMLVQWAAMEAKKVALSAAASQQRTATETIGGGVSGGGGWLSGLFGGGGGGASSGVATAGWTIAAFAVVYLAVKQWIKTNRPHFAELSLAADQGKMWLSYVKGTQGDMAKLQAQTAGLIKGLVDLSNQLGLSIESIAGMVNVGRTGQGKKTNYYVKYAEGLVRSFGGDAQAAMEFAMIQALRQADFRIEPSPLLREYLKQTMAESLEQFQREWSLLSEISNVSMPDTIVSIRQSVTHFEQLRQALASLLQPSAATAQAFLDLADAEIQAWQASRDAITGRQKTAEEEYQDRVRQAQLWNAERELRLVQLKMSKLELEGEIARLKARKQIVGTNIDLNRVEFEIGARRLEGLAELYQSEGALFAGFVRGMSEIVNVSTELLEQQLAAINAIIENFPTAIDIGEIEWPSVGGGGVSAVTDQVDNVLDELTRAWLEATRNTWGLAILDVDAWSAEMRERLLAAGLGAEELADAIAKLDQVERHRRDRILRDALDAIGAQDAAAGLRAIADALAYVLQQLRASSATDIEGEDAATARALAAAQAFILVGDALAGMTQDARLNFELSKIKWALERANLEAQLAFLRAQGLISAEQLAMLQAAFASLPSPEEWARQQARQSALGDLAGLGSATAASILEFERLQKALEWVRANAALAGLSLEQLAAMEAEIGRSMALSLADGLARYIENEDIRRQLEQMRFELEMANYRLQFEMLQALGLLTAEQIEFIRGLFDWIAANPPTFGAGAPATGGTGGRSFGGGGRSFGDAVDKFGITVEELMRFQKELLTGPNSPLKPREKLAVAEASYLQIMQRALAGDVEAQRQFQGAASAYLEAARAVYGSTQAYTDIFNSVLAAINRLAAVVAAVGGGLGGATGGAAGRFGAGQGGGQGSGLGAQYGVFGDWSGGLGGSVIAGPWGTAARNGEEQLTATWAVVDELRALREERRNADAETAARQSRSVSGGGASSWSPLVRRGRAS